MPLLFISEGKINTKNLELTRITKEELAAFLKEQNASVRQVSVMTLDNNGKVYLQLKGQSYQTLTLPLKEGVAW